MSSQVLCVPEALSWETLSSRKSGDADDTDSLIPDTSCVPQVLFLGDFEAWNWNCEANGLSCWLLLSLGYPEPYSASMSWGNLPREAWSTKHPGLQILSCRPILH